MHRTPLQPAVPYFQHPTMPNHPDSAFPMSERYSHSLNSPTVVPSSSFEEPRSKTLGYERRMSPSFNGERPNPVISGHRKFHKGLFTGARGNFDSHANRIVAKLEENEALMDDSPVSEQLRKEALRDMPQCLTMKKCVKMKLSKSVSQRSKRKPIGFWKSLKYKININFSKFVSSLKNFNYFELWHGSLKDIEGRFGSGYASYFKFLRWLFVMNFVIALLSFTLLTVPQIIYDLSDSNGTAENNQSFDFKDIFIGQGSFLETVLYYGHYTSNYFEVIPYLIFDMPAAYFSVIVILYLISFIILAVSVAENYRRTFIETEGGLQNVYANRVFCGWDYAIATKEAAQLKSSSIYNELKELLSEEIKDRSDWTFLEKFWTLTIQIIVNVMVMVILGGVGWLTWVLLKESQSNNSIIFVNAIVVNLIIMAFPTIFTYISRYEDYQNPRTALYITLIRTFLLGAVIVGVVIAFWFIKAETTGSWENQLASEIYRLIIYDFLFSVILSTLIDLGYCAGRYFYRRDPKSEFNVAKHTLQIIYNQGLFWVGFVYSPLLPLIVTLKMFVIWYVRKVCVNKLCSPPKRTWRAAQAQTWFMMMTFLSILLIIAAHGFGLRNIKTSSRGPFSHYNYTYEIITNNIDNLEKDEFWKIVMNVTKPGGVAFIMIALGIWVYYLREKAYGNREKVRMLKETLIWMTTDKKYLVQMYNNVTKGEINPYLRDNRFVDPSKVLPQEYVEELSAHHEEEVSARFKKYT